MLQTAAMLAIGSRALAGAVVTDGSLGSAATLSGPNFAIPASLGKLQGKNLFHSFSQLNLSAGEVAAFSGPATVKEVLARVTGGASSIDGTLRVSIPHANFYLINPAGVLFGPNAALDLTGSFTVTTVDQIKLTDGKVFGAIGSGDAALSSAAPAAFGFLNATPAGVTVNASVLRVPTGKSLTVAAGPIQIFNGAIVRAPGGTLSVLSVGAPTEATISPGHAPVVPAAATLGDVTETGNSFLSTTGTGGGRIEVRAHNFSVDDSTVESRTQGATDGQGIGIDLSGRLQGSDHAIFTNTSGSGRAGDIDVRADAYEADQGVSAKLTGIDARSYSTTGAAGNITLHVNNVIMLDGQQINTSSAGADGGTIAIVAAESIRLSGYSANAAADPAGFLANSTGKGKAGDIRIHAGSLQLDPAAIIIDGTTGTGADGRISITTDALTVHGLLVDHPTGITTATDATSSATGGSLSVKAHAIHLIDTGALTSQTLGSGNAGPVTVTADSLGIYGGSLDSKTLGAGSSGSVVVNVGTLRMDGTNAIEPTEISAGADPTSSGNAGSVRVRAKLAVIANGADVNTSTFGKGSAGNVSVSADELRIEGYVTSGGLTGIDSNAQQDSAGNGGSVFVKAGILKLLAGGEISSDTDGAGRGGDVNVVAGQLSLDAVNANLAPRISSDTQGADTGAAGSVRIHAGAVKLVNGGRIDSTTYGKGSGGNISLTSQKLSIDGQNAFSLTGVVAESQPGSSGRAGNISIRSGRVTLHASGSVSTDTFGSGDGGNISLTADQLSIDGSDTTFQTAIAAAAPTGSTGNAGAIDIAANTIHLVSDGAIVTDTVGPGNAGALNIRGGTVTVDDRDGHGFTRISSGADLGSSGDAGPVTVHADSLSVIAGGQLASTTSGAGRGGDVAVVGNEVKIDGRGTHAFTGIAADTLQIQTGDAGAIRVHANALSIAHGGRIDDDSNGAGNGGNVSITAGDFRIDGSSSNKFSGVSSVSERNSTGASGSVAVRSENLNLRNGGGITAETFGTGRGGDVSVDAHRIVGSGGNSPFATQINASALLANSGSAGTVRVDAHDIHLVSASINSENAGAGAGGNVIVHASHFIAGSQGGTFGSGISAQANPGGGGSAGSIIASFNQAELTSGGVITSSTSSPGAAGDVTLRARSLRIDGENANFVTGVISNAQPGSGGNAGSVNARIGSGEILNGGQIASNTLSSGNGGNVDVVADNLLLNRNNGPFATAISAASVGEATGSGGSVHVLSHGDLTLRGGAAIQAISLRADGGDVDVTASNLTLNQGVIATSAAGAGGNVQIGPGQSFVISPGSSVTAAAGGTRRSDNGGNVSIGPTALAFLPGAGAETISATANQGNGGNITINTKTFLRGPDTPANAIDSSSLGGIAGQIILSSPDVDLSGELVPLVAGLQSQGISLAPTCAYRVGSDQSSFTLEGGNGLPSDPESSKP